MPPVGWHSTVEHEPQSTTVCAWLKTVVLRWIGGRGTRRRELKGRRGRAKDAAAEVAAASACRA